MLLGGRDMRARMNSDDIDRGPKRQLEHKCGRARARRKPAYELRPGIGKDTAGQEVGSKFDASTIPSGRRIAVWDRDSAEQAGANVE